MAARRVGLRAHASGLPSASWPSGSRLPLFGTHRFGVATRRVGASARRVGSSAFRFGDCRSVGWPSGSPLPLFGMHRFGVALGELVLLPSVSAFATRRVGLRAHGFRFLACAASGLPLGGLVLPPPASEIAARRVGLRAHDFRFRHAPLRGCRSVGWPSGSRLPLFGTHRSAPPHRRREGRRSAPTRHLFHFKTLIPTC